VIAIFERRVVHESRRPRLLATLLVPSPPVQVHAQRLEDLDVSDHYCLIAEFDLIGEDDPAAAAAAAAANAASAASSSAPAAP